MKDRYIGFSGDSPRNALTDLKMVPRFLQRLADDGSTPQYACPMCTGGIRSKGQDELLHYINTLNEFMVDHGAQSGFMNAAPPSVISLILQNDFYAKREADLAALADVMEAEYETVIGAGLYLQLDCPDLALSRNMLFSDLSDEVLLRLQICILRH